MIRTSPAWCSRCALTLRQTNAVFPHGIGLATQLASSRHAVCARTVHQYEPARGHPPRKNPVTGGVLHNNELLNPPASSRPPVLEEVSRNDYSSRLSYLFAAAKSYLRFYKDGMKSVFTNRRELKRRLSLVPAADRPSIWRPLGGGGGGGGSSRGVPQTLSRADWVLLWRVRHDLLRLPLFGLVLIACGEFTVFVVAYVEAIVPYVCRLPAQLRADAEKAEQRRRQAFDWLEKAYPQGALDAQVTRAVARAHALRTLHLSGVVWDRLGLSPPPGMWQVKGELRMTFLDGDDEKMLAQGGPGGLVTDELRMACLERGIDVLGKRESDMRTSLGDWLRLTAAKDATERRRRVTTLLMTRQAHWPKTRDFFLPDWHL